MTPRLFVEPPVSESEAVRWTTEAERAVAAGFASERRRREYLGWRSIVRRELGGVKIGYNAVGAPVLEGCAVHIGVSHCAERIAVCMADVPCAVDIEPLGRNFLRAASRYMTPVEHSLSYDSRLPAAVWCAKETLYKYAGRRGLDLRDDLRVVSVDFAAGRIRGAVLDGPEIDLSVVCREGFLIVCTF